MAVAVTLSPGTVAVVFDSGTHSTGLTHSHWQPPEPGRPDLNHLVYQKICCATR